MLQDFLTVLREKTQKWLNQDKSSSALVLRDAPVWPNATVVVGNPFTSGASALRNGNGLSGTRRELYDREIPNLVRHTVAPLGEPPSCLSLCTDAQYSLPDASQSALSVLDSRQTDAMTIRSIYDDTLGLSFASRQNQQAVPLPSRSAVCDENDVISISSQATEESVDVNRLEHYLRDLPWHILSSLVEDDETTSNMKTASIKCNKELFDVVLGPRGHRLRLIQRRSRVLITAYRSELCFKLHGHPRNIAKVKDFVDVLLVRLQVTDRPYVIVNLEGPSVRPGLEALSSAFAGLGNVVEEHELHFTVTRFSRTITIKEMHAACNAIEAILPDIQALVTPVVLHEVAYKHENANCVKPRCGSPFHRIYDLIHDALNDAGIPHKHGSKLHVTLVKKKHRISEGEKIALRNVLFRSMNVEEIVGPVVPVSVHISQKRSKDCFGSRNHIAWATLRL
ncbi:hypothetical protein BX666DRAFT_2029760 [Dichotomocladium elegans]|nr:hypothetical protein BX666DRAFT_2029760 [Dichotomocladium elegans]